MERNYESVLESGVKIDKKNLSKGYKYGRSLIPFDFMDEKVLEYKSGEKGMWLIGFCDMNAVPRENFMGESEVIVGNDEESNVGISSLIEAMIETKSLAIVRFIKRANAKVMLGVLIPISKASPSNDNSSNSSSNNNNNNSENNNNSVYYFIFNKLPFAEDLRHYHFPSLSPSLSKKNFKPSTQQLTSVRDFILSFDLHTPLSSSSLSSLSYNLHDKEEVKEEMNPLSLLKPKYTFNPTLQHFYQSLQSRALYNYQIRKEKEGEGEGEGEGKGKGGGKKSAPLFSSLHSFLSNKKSEIPPLDNLISDYINPSNLLLQNSASSIHSLKQNFVFTNLQTTAKSKKRTFWSEMFTENIQKETNLSSYVQSSFNKKQKNNPEGGDFFSLSNILSGGVDSVGSIHPIDDFEKMMKRRDVDLVDTAIQQMQKVIFQIVDDSLGNQFYGKAIEAIKVLRKGCIEEEESLQFNSFLNQSKIFYKNKRKNDFFLFLEKNKIFPISIDESDDSNLTNTQATMFFEKDENQNNVNNNNQPNENDDIDIDDLFDKIE
eukprot:TRINITY_DN901_c1_g1_i1.p1 TRINITY_DN901_c1_g1~~TRINITY_DN901_c1_g1_i1.p1  ORF type:complete len:600 (+),score=299.96 TRINITY_DN901_c1_g1_i1:166-1800(+)